MLKIVNLHVSVDNQPIVKGVSLTIKPGELHVLMGPNGSGKTSLAQALMGNPEYHIKYQISNIKYQKAKIILDGDDIVKLSPDQRSRKGLFLAFQQPLEVSGVSVGKFLWQAYNQIKNEKLKIKNRNRKYKNHLAIKPFSHKTISIDDFYRLLQQKAKILQMDEKFLERGLNEGFSGGEKKKLEMLQMLVLQPKYAIIDEIDTGLDIDSLKLAAKCINTLVEKKVGILLITHYQRLLKFLKPDFVSVMIGGKIVNSGKADLATKIEREGYRSFSLKKNQIKY